MPDKCMFAPLPLAGRPRRSPAPAADWRPILPVPNDAPTGPPSRERRGKPAACWTYRDAAGGLLGYVLRFNLPDGDKEFLPATWCRHTTTGACEWRFKAWLAPRPLYGLDRLAQRPAAPVVVTEGEKAADAAAKLLPDYVALTSPNGAKGAGKADWTVLRGRDITIWPDNDDEGRAYAAAVAKALRGIAKSVRIVALPPGMSEKWDAADALAEGWDQARAGALIAAAVPAGAAPAAAPGGSSGDGGGRQRRQRDDLLDYLPEIELWHSPDREAFATIKVGGHFENWPVRSKDFREWLSGRHFVATATAPGNQAMEEALRVFEGYAKHHCPEHQVFLRIGERDGAVYIDLGDAAWRAIEVKPDGWRVIDRAPVKFVRSPAMRALPVPEGGGLIEQELSDLVNVHDDADFVLIVAWLVGCFNPRGPYPILAISGEQGSAKSTLCRLLRTLTDPMTAPVRLPPRNEDDLIVAARNSRVLAFDNMSDVPGWLSDALCSLATGAGVSTREHYSNTNEVVFEGARPIAMNGIPDLGSRADFADRTLRVVLKPIAEADRRSEAEYWREVETRLPLIFGAMLDAVSRALRDRDTVPPPVTRMADFEVWVTAAEPALGWEKGAFIGAYLGNRKGQVEAAIEADPIGEAVCQLVEQEDWLGSPTELLARLGEKVTDAVRKSRTWPAANKLRGRLRRLAGPLRERGITLDLDDRANDAARTRLIGIRRDRSVKPP
jgi:putative DNA primase/helicase